jgi:hypothetical protein
VSAAWARLVRAVAWLRGEPVTVITGFVGACALVAASLGLNVSPGRLATVDGFIAAVLALLARTQTTSTARAARSAANRAVTGSHPTRKLGRRAPSNKPAIRLSRLLTGVLPAHPASEDYGSAFTGWKMLGNDQAGDCEAVETANNRALVSTVLGGATDYSTQADVWAFYQTQNPGFIPGSGPHGYGSSDDGGMDMQTANEAKVKVGIGGVKAVAFAKVDHTNPDEIAAALAIFGCVSFGITVLDANQTEFSEGQPWDVVAGSAVDGGHAVVGVGYPELSGAVRFVTWAEETSWTDAFDASQVEEAWVVIWPEHLTSAAFLAGVNVEQLAADYLALTGSALDVPTPAPTPTPGAAVVEVTYPAMVAHLEGLAAKNGETADEFLAAILAKRYPTVT